MGLQILSLAMIILLSWSSVLSAPVAPLADQWSQPCQRKCGDQIVPYPFGILGDSEDCFRNSSYRLLCNHADFNPPKLFFGNIPILNISEANSTAIIQLPAAVTCYDQLGEASSTNNQRIYLGSNRPFTFSTSLNKFTAIGCFTYGLFKYGNEEFGTGCVLRCDNKTIIPDPTKITQQLIPSPCSDSLIGCCHTEVPKDIKNINISVRVQDRRPTDRYASNPCDYGYLAVAPNFSLKMTPEEKLYSEVAIDWAIGENCEKTTSVDGVPNPPKCGQHTSCTNSENGPGYICRCKQGYKDNPYIGCKDVNECETDQHPCKRGTCKNTRGNYTCECPFGYEGDGKVGCSINTASKIMIGIGAIIFLVALVLFLRWRYKKKIQEINDRNNGGLVLENLSMKKFKESQLEKATNNFDARELLGEGGNGWVYKGSIENMIDIAVKKSKVVDQDQIEQFLNEADIVSKLNHKNVVKLLGVCSESKVPMLVYEFMPNGTLSHHIHESGSRLLSSWHICLRILAETARALNYMHSQADPPIIHRDVKPSNILLDGTFTAKVSDFGTSKLIPKDQPIAPTQGQGTRGYLDPEYVQTGELTTMSDVYGFGVVLMELLSKQKPLTLKKPGEMIILVKEFASAVENNQLDQVLKVPVVTERENEEVQIVAKLAVRCISMHSKDRPTMMEVVDVLNGLSKEYHSSEVEGNQDELVSLLDDQDFIAASFDLEYSNSV